MFLKVIKAPVGYLLVPRGYLLVLDVIEDRVGSNGIELPRQLKTLSVVSLFKPIWSFSTFSFASS